jgi:hypothetical protein
LKKKILQANDFRFSWYVKFKINAGMDKLLNVMKNKKFIYRLESRITLEYLLGSILEYMEFILNNTTFTRMEKELT